MQHRRMHVWDDKRWGTDWHWGAHSYKPLTSRQSNEDLALDKAGFNGKEEKKTEVSHIKSTMDSEFGCNMELQNNEQRERCKCVLVNV